jgi:hypothetical protein
MRRITILNHELIPAPLNNINAFLMGFSIVISAGARKTASTVLFTGCKNKIA